MGTEPKYTLAEGPDVKDEDVVLPSGRRLTEDVRQELLDEARKAAGRAGRPSLGEAGSRSPQVAFRLPEDQMRRAKALAGREGATVSEIARRALEEYLTAH